MHPLQNLSSCSRLGEDRANELRQDHHLQSAEGCGRGGGQSAHSGHVGRWLRVLLGLQPAGAAGLWHLRFRFKCHASHCGGNEGGAVLPPPPPTHTHTNAHLSDMLLTPCAPFQRQIISLKTHFPLLTDLKHLVMPTPRQIVAVPNWRAKQSTGQKGALQLWQKSCAEEETTCRGWLQGCVNGTQRVYCSTPCELPYFCRLE